MGATQKQPASEAMEKFFPPRYMDGSDGSDYDQSVLESYLIEKWASLRSKSVHDCVRIYLNCTRKWQFFGAQLFSVQVSTSTAILLSYCKTSALETFQDFLIKLDIKQLMHLLKISIFSLNNVILRLTKIMNRADKNWAHF